MSKGNSTYSQRRRRWLALAPPRTRSLAAHVDQLLVPMVLEEGFGEPAVIADDPRLKVSGRVMDLWRAVSGDQFQFVRFELDKYRAPRFQLRFGEIERSGDRWIGFRSSGLVPSNKRHFHEWGKPKWCPTRFWSDRDNQKVVAGLVPMIPQIFRFFSDGTRGTNLGAITDESDLVIALQSSGDA